MPYSQMQGMSMVCRLYSASQGGGIILKLNEVSFLLSQRFSSTLQVAGVGLVSVNVNPHNWIFSLWNNISETKTSTSMFCFNYLNILNILCGTCTKEGKRSPLSLKF